MIWLKHEQARTIVSHAHAGTPNEVCGILAGSNGYVTEIIPIENAAANPQQSYYMEERALAHALLSLNRRGLSVQGFYHSHPTGDPVPSPTDVRYATYPDIPCLIIGLKGEPRIAAWRISYGDVTPVAVHVGDTRPEQSLTTTLTKAQKVAIMLSALIALLLVIVLSLSLLPPAPPIP